jgi:hypothetical protein
MVTITNIVVNDGKGYFGQDQFAYCDVSGDYHAVPS